jgi:DNA polymerase elongation subunit (family B)
MDDGTEIQQQNICRYYPSKTGGKLVKIMPPLEGKEDDGERDLSIDSEWKVKTCNKMVDFDWEIDYDYYIQAVEKLLEPFRQSEK